MTATLRIESIAGAGMLGPKHGSYKVFLDGVLVGKIKRKVPFEKSVAAGPHEFHVKDEWHFSNELRGDFQAGEVARFSCKPAGNPLTSLLRLVGIGGEYFSLDPVEG